MKILKDCIPKEVYKFISDAEGTPKHKHKTLILNLACGPSVLVDSARHELLQG